MWLLKCFTLDLLMIFLMKKNKDQHCLSNKGQDLECVSNCTALKN